MERSRLTALVTGAGGYVGGLLLRSLEARGTPVVGAGHGAGDAHIRSVDFRMADEVLALIEQAKPAVVYHLAGTSCLAEMLRDPHGGNYNVVQPAVNVMEALAARCPGARLVLVSPCDVYGRAGRLPTDERAPLQPADLYGAARAAVEYMSAAYRARGVDVVIARVFHFTGPGQDTRSPLGEAAHRAARGLPVVSGALSLRRDICDVRDTVEGLICLAAGGEQGTAYNLCSGEAHGLGTLIERVVAGRVPVEAAPARSGEVQVYLGSAERAEALGWKRRYSLEQTLHDLRASHDGAVRRS